MINNDKGVIQIRQAVEEKLARLEWAGNINEDTLAQIPYEISPGPMATWRCCVYKEREIVRWRIRLASGQDGSPEKPGDNIIQVIDPACEECPLSAYTVTDNCRLCIGKACQSNCRFGAISMTETRSHIDPNKCRECGKCAEACPYGAIAHLIRPCQKACPVKAITYDEYGRCRIDSAKCIRCGMCLHSCPFGAIASKAYILPIIRAIKAGREVIAMCAPATEGQFGKDITMASVRAALKELGFADMVEVGLGGDMTAAWESAEWSQARREGRKLTTSCCPAFINMLRRHFPDQYKDNMSEVVSPMCAVSRYLKAVHPGCVTVFIGPCMAKKSESQEMGIEGNADYVMSYGEFSALLKSRDIELKPVEDEYQEALDEYNEYLDELMDSVSFEGCTIEDPGDRIRFEQKIIGQNFPEWAGLELVQEEFNDDMAVTRYTVWLKVDEDGFVTGIMDIRAEGLEREGMQFSSYHDVYPDYDQIYDMLMHERMSQNAETKDAEE